MRPRPGRTSPATCQRFMGCRPMGREQQCVGHTGRSCFVWPRHLQRSWDDEAKLNGSSAAYSFDVTLNGSISTERGAVLLEKPQLVDVVYPLRNNRRKRAPRSSWRRPRMGELRAGEAKRAREPGAATFPATKHDGRTTALVIASTRAVNVLTIATVQRGIVTREDAGTGPFEAAWGGALERMR